MRQMQQLMKLLAFSAITTAMLLSTATVFAQEAGRTERRRGEFDPAQFQERMLERYREVLEFTSDEEWNAVKPLVQKVMQARMEAFGGMGRGMFRPPRRGGEAQGQGEQDRQRGPRFGPSSPAADALEEALNSKASTEVIKAKLAALREERKQRQAALAKAQEDLRKVLNTRREALAVLNGLLD